MNTTLSERDQKLWDIMLGDLFSEVLGREATIEDTSRFALVGMKTVVFDRQPIAEVTEKRLVVDGEEQYHLSYSLLSTPSM